MDFVYTWAYTTLVIELIIGMEHTKQLRAYLSSIASTSEETPNLLLQKILSSYEQSLLILKCAGSPIQSQPAADGRSTPRSDEKKRSFNDHQELIDISKKRKLQPTWTERDNVDESGFEGPTDDGYNWRKYGQKDILGAKYPRSYYRCMYRHIRNCRATKQVQRSDDDPTAFEITYKGSHTCQHHQVTNSTPQATSPEKQANHQSLIGRGYLPYFVGTEDGFDSFEGLIDDGYNWSKYGQKLIRGAKYSRGYYRCMYRYVRNCWAKEQVLRLNDDPTVFEIIYKGSHTCQLPTNSTLQETSVPEKQANDTNLIGSGYSPYFVGTEDGFDSFEGLIDDGYTWRKYGQKLIRGAKYPRGYYRCMYRYMRNCWAKKQVQRLNDDPTVVEIICKGSHTCQLPTNSTLQETSVPEKQANDTNLIGSGYSPYFVGTEDGFDPFEGHIDDGYTWRKYGQKLIRGAKYSRGYYRCMYLHCVGKKRVQKSDDDPTAFEIIYKGSHTCHLPTNSPLEETSVVPEKEASQNSLILGRHSPSSVCSTTPHESKYFSVSSCQLNDFGIVHNLDHSESYLSDIGIFLDLHHSDSDRTDTLSANTSTTTSSISGDSPRLDFSIWSKRLPQIEDNTPPKDE